jgi:hypothetical protein
MKHIRIPNLPLHAYLIFNSVDTEYLGAFGTDTPSWSHSWGFLDGSGGNPQFIKLQCENFAFISLPHWPTSSLASSMFERPRGADDQDSGSSSSGEVWRVRSTSGSCRVCDNSVITKAGMCGDESLSTQCSASCQTLQFEYDFKSDKLIITPPTCNFSACSVLSDHDAAMLIKPLVMQRSADRIPVEAIQHPFKDLKSYMYENKVFEFKNDNSSAGTMHT